MIVPRFCRTFRLSYFSSVRNAAAFLRDGGLRNAKVTSYIARRQMMFGRLLRVMKTAIVLNYSFL